ADLGADPVFGDGRDAVPVEHTDQLAVNLRLQFEIAIGASRGHGRSRSAHRQGAIRSHLVSLDLRLMRSMRLQLYPEPPRRRGVHAPLEIMQEPQDRKSGV